MCCIWDSVKSHRSFPAIVLEIVETAHGPVEGVLVVLDRVSHRDRTVDN